MASNLDNQKDWVNAGGIFGRGVLVDYLSWAESQNIEIKGTTTTSITLDEVLACAKHQNLTFQPGDILFIRTGWARSFFALSEEEVTSLFSVKDPPAIGLESGPDILQWLWENKFAAVAGDQPSLEAWPCQDLDHWLHEWLLAGWGMPIGELFDLERLAAECKRVGKWSFLFSSMPIHVSLLPSHFTLMGCWLMNTLSSRFLEVLPVRLILWRFCEYWFEFIVAYIVTQKYHGRSLPLTLRRSKLKVNRID